MPFFPYPSAVIMVIIIIPILIIILIFTSSFASSSLSPSFNYPYDHHHSKCSHCYVVLTFFLRLFFHHHCYIIITMIIILLSLSFLSVSLLLPSSPQPFGQGSLENTWRNLGSTDQWGNPLHERVESKRYWSYSLLRGTWPAMCWTTDTSSTDGPYSGDTWGEILTGWLTHVYINSSADAAENGGSGVFIRTSTGQTINHTKNAVGKKCSSFKALHGTVAYIAEIKPWKNCHSHKLRSSSSVSLLEVCLASQSTYCWKTCSFSLKDALLSNSGSQPIVGFFTLEE